MKIIRGLIFGIILCLMTTAAAVAGRKTVLIIESYHPDLAWTSQCEQGIREVLGKTAALSSFYMDTKRIPEKEFPVKAAEAWKTFRNLKPDLVMIGDDNALKLLGPELSKTSTPAVFFGINDNPRQYFQSMPANVTGVLERTPVVPWVRNLKRIVPWAGRALILMDDSLTSEAIRDLVFQGKHSISLSGMTLEYKLVGMMDEWENVIMNSKSFDFILMPTFHAVKDDMGKHVSVDTIIAWTSARTPVPVFTNQDYTVGDKGVIGAFVIYGKNHGRRAAEIARDILENGKKPHQILPVTDRDGVYYFNKRQLNRFALELPPDIQKSAVFK